MDNDNVEDIFKNNEPLSMHGYSLDDNGQFQVHDFYSVTAYTSFIAETGDASVKIAQEAYLGAFISTVMMTSIPKRTRLGFDDEGKMQSFEVHAPFETLVKIPSLDFHSCNPHFDVTTKADALKAHERERYLVTLRLRMRFDSWRRLKRAHQLTGADNRAGRHAFNLKLNRTRL
jgi:hypothetical protein